MPLILLVVAVLVLGLGLVQAWTIWFLKREIQRLEFRLNEALDDEDLLEFQERLKGLLDQAKETARSLAESVDERRKSLEKSLEKARQAEKSLALRILARSATAEGPDRLPPKSAKNENKGRGKTGTKAKPASGSPVRAPRSGAAPADPLREPSEPGRNASADGGAFSPAAPWESRSEGEARRSYLVRPQAAPARYQNIYDLADQGLSPEQIAKDAGLLAGEVALILNLRRKEPPKA